MRDPSAAKAVREIAGFLQAAKRAEGQTFRCPICGAEAHVERYPDGMFKFAECGGCETAVGWRGRT